MRPCLGGVGVDDADVLVAVRALEDDLLHVAADDAVVRDAQLGVDEVQELVDVAQQLVGDALARGVDGALEPRNGEDHGGREHADADGLAEAPGRGDEDLLVQGVPAVELQDPLVVPGKGPLGLDLCRG